MAGSLKILAFAGARDVLGVSELNIEMSQLGGTAQVTVEQVLDAICERHPELTSYRPLIRVAVNSSYCDLGDPVRSGDEVALIPPVAGG